MPSGKEIEDNGGEAYSQAANSGLYVKETGIHGKYDNVRIYWEDALTRLFLRPHIDRLVKRRIEDLKRLRILDLGCGSGDGYDMLMSLMRKNPGIAEDEVRIILPDYLGQYHGVDLNESLLAQAKVRWCGKPKMRFNHGDFSKGLPLSEGEPSYDLYFTSFGALSHLNEDQTVRLFSDIVNHCNDGSLIIGDWLGRYSYEWQDFWKSDNSEEQWMDYVISYIYPPGERGGKELTHLNLRLLCRDEVKRILARVEDQTGARIEAKELFDRSLFVGRHMDTCDYNPHLKPLRRTVNNLHEDNVRTVLEKLLIDFRPHPDFDFLNGMFDMLCSCWNTLVRYTLELSLCYDEEEQALKDPPDIPSHYPDPLKRAMKNMRRVVEGVGWFEMGDPRANIIEPQLGYSLRSLELSFQQGNGMGHGLVGVFEVRKS